MKNSRRLLVCFMFLSATVVGPAFGATISWTTWTSQPTSASANGTLTVNGSPVSMSYAGEIGFTQLNGTGTNFFQPATTFTAPPLVMNSPPSDMIAISGTATTHTITFGTAVVDPVMAIVSLGQPSISTQYIFSLSAGQSMSILNQGPSTAWGTCSTPPCLVLAGTNLAGHEGDGIIQFTGTFTTLTWTGANPEFWNGFTFGVAAVSAEIPEPATWGMILIACIAGIPIALRRRKA